MASRRLVFAPAAARDLEAVSAYIAAENPRAARTEVSRIVRRAASLIDFPLLGTRRFQLAANLHALVEVPYVIFCYPHDDRIEIVRVLHGSRDIEAEITALTTQRFPDDTA